MLAVARNGYVHDLEIYTGKDLDGNPNDIGLCIMVVVELLEGYEKSGLHLYTDNYYTSPTWCLHLYMWGSDACGTARVKRKKFPRDLVTVTTMKNRGFYDYRGNGPLLACVD